MRHFQQFLALTFLLTISMMACDLIRTPEDCEADLSAMEEEVDQIVSAARSCERDSDCTAFDPSNSCFGACPVAINLSDSSWVGESIAVAEFKYCVGFAEQCGYSLPSCPALEPQCVSGACTLVDTTAGP